MNWLSDITILCFAASYGVALVLEFCRVVRKLPLNAWLSNGFTVAGITAHSIYLVELAREESHTAGAGMILSSWYDWCLLAAWWVAGAYVGLQLRRPKNHLGIFLLPMVLILVGFALVADRHPFARETAAQIWRSVHATALLAGSVSVTLGFAAGVMYLVQAYRLKHKLASRGRFRLPPLEWLQRFNRETLWISIGCLLAGLVAGVVLNVRVGGSAGGGVAWSEPAVVASLVLLAWLVTVTLFELVYRPARVGRKVAYLTLASFLFLVLALLLTLLSGHATGATADAASADDSFRQPGRIR